MTDRGAVVIVENEKVALIQREKAGQVYYVFPGGKQELGETIEQCAQREAFEELGVEVEIRELLTIVPFNGTQYYFCAKIIGGQFGTGQAEEYLEVDNGTYLPVWIKISDLCGKNVIPDVVVQALYSK